MVTLEVMSLASGHLYTVALISVQSRGQDRFFPFLTLFSWALSVCANRSSKLNEVFAGSWAHGGHRATSSGMLDYSQHHYFSALNWADF